ncbi:MAG: elongation factor Ts [Mollicutes bacterium]|nr:elongation factor Ts [Mollicutes bacterium]
MIDSKKVAELRSITGAGILDCRNALVETNGDLDAAVDYLREKGIAKASKKAERIAAEGLANIFVDGNKAIIMEVNSETDFVSRNEEFTSMIELIGKTILNSNVTTMEEALNLDCKEGSINDLVIAKTAKIGEKLSFRRFEIITKNDNENFGSYLHLGGKIAVLTVVEGATEEVAKDVAMQAAAMKPEYISKDDVPAEVVEKEKKILTEEAINEGKPADIAEKMVQGRINKFFKEVCLIHQAFIKDGEIDVETYVKNNNGKVLKMIRYEVGEGMEKRNDNFAEEVMNQIK